MEALIAIFVFMVLGWVILKIFAMFLHVGIFMITLPLKILGIVIALVLTPIILVPLGLLAGLAGIFGLILAPLTMLVPFLPLALIGVGIWFLLKRG